MAKIHFLNVGDGDCSIIEHNSGRITVFDICNGNAKRKATEVAERVTKVASFSQPKGNFGMRNRPTQPIDYLADLNPERVWRFVLSHPDMDHMDGLQALSDNFKILNFWDSGLRKEKPEFSNQGRYKEEDWDTYIKFQDDKAGANLIQAKSGSKFNYANSDDMGKGGDGIKILAPSKELVTKANESQDFNDASYVLLYRTAGKKIVFGGDSHDGTWEHILDNFESDVKDCDVLIAPHHGRHSGRSWEFLDVLKPRITLFGCADSDHLAYDAWTSRKLKKITNNQAGNIVMETVDNMLYLYVQNATFAEAAGMNTSIINSQGYVFMESY